jgi:hypothetical protein
MSEDLRKLALNVEAIALEYIDPMKGIFQSHWIVSNIEDADQLTKELARFLTLKAIDYDIDASIYSPSNLVDAGWHVLLLFPKLYYTLSQKLLVHNIKGIHVESNILIDHDPFGGSYGRKERYENSLNRYRELFNEAPNGKFWKSVEETIQGYAM